MPKKTETSVMHFISLQTKKKAVELILKAREFEMFEFLWTWKMATTEALWRRFFPNNPSPEYTYIRINQLKNEGFLESIPIDRNAKHFVWTLTQRSFNSLKETLETRVTGYASENLEHDFIVMAVHLGEALRTYPDKLGMLTEQELRWRNPEGFPSQIPLSDLHRSDGYWYSLTDDDRSKTIALEVELTQQGKDKYELAADVYRRAGIRRVFWVTRTEGMAKNIWRRLDKYSSFASEQHVFFNVEDFFNKGWGTKAILGCDIGKSIRDILADTFALPLHPDNSCYTHAILNTMKRRRKSFICPLNKETEDVVCMANRPYSNSDSSDYRLDPEVPPQELSNETL